MNLTWSSRAIKYILFLFNFLFVISGIIMISVGVSVKAFYEDYNLFLGSQYFSLPNLLIAIGSLIFFISFLGCCGALKENWFMIFIFAVLLALIFVLEFSAGIAGYVLRADTASYLSKELKETIDMYVSDVEQNHSSSVVHLWDFIQSNFECCGADKPQDWQDKFFNQTNNHYSLPVSCCKPLSGIIGNSTCELNSTVTSVPYMDGCVEGFGEYIQDHAVTLGGVGMTIAIIQLFGVIFACHLARQIKHGYYST